MESRPLAPEQKKKFIELSKQLKTHHILQLDFDGVIAGNDAEGRPIYISKTLEKVKESSSVVDIFTSMDISTIRNEIGNLIPNRNNPNIPTRINGVKKLKETIKSRQQDNNNNNNDHNLSSMNVRVITPADVFDQNELGSVFDREYRYLYKLFEQHINEMDENIDFNALASNSDYQNLLIKEFYRRILGNIFTILVTGNYEGMQLSSAVPLALALNELLPLNLKNVLENTIQSPHLTPTALFNCFELLRNQLFESELLLCCIDLLLILSNRTISENNDNNNNDHPNKRNCDNLRNNFLKFLTEKSEVDFIKPVSAIFHLVKDFNVRFNPEKLLMSLYTWQQHVNHANDGDIIHLEYCDDLEHNLDAMLFALEHLMKSCNKRLEINLTTTLVKGLNTGEYKLIPYINLQISTLTLSDHLAHHFKALKAFYIRVETGRQKRLDDFDVLIGQLLHEAPLNNAIELIENQFRYHKKHSKFGIIFQELRSSQQYQDRINKYTTGHHYSRLLALTLQEIYTIGSTHPDIEIISTHKAANDISHIVKSIESNCYKNLENNNSEKKLEKPVFTLPKIRHLPRLGL